MPSLMFVRQAVLGELKRHTDRIVLYILDVHLLIIVFLNKIALIKTLVGNKNLNY